MKCTIHNQIQMTCSPGFQGNEANEYSEPLVIRFEQPWQREGCKGRGVEGNANILQILKGGINRGEKELYQHRLIKTHITDSNPQRDDCRMFLQLSLSNSSHLLFTHRFHGCERLLPLSSCSACPSSVFAPLSHFALSLISRAFHDEEHFVDGSCFSFCNLLVLPVQLARQYCSALPLSFYIVLV